MIVAPLLGAALIINVATGPAAGPSAGEASLTLQQKAAATAPLVRSATDCIVHAVTSRSPFFRRAAPGDGRPIVESIRSCRTPVRAMIDAYDHYYGEGSGEAFFMGPYLDVLPKAVLAGTNKSTE